MQKKCGKFLADWYDEQGKRKRRAFKTAAQATRYARRMKNESAEKKAHASGLSARSLRHGKRAARKTRLTTPSARKFARRGRPSLRTSSQSQ